MQEIKQLDKESDEMYIKRVAALKYLGDKYLLATKVKRKEPKK